MLTACAAKPPPEPPTWVPTSTTSSVSPGEAGLDVSGHVVGHVERGAVRHAQRDADVDGVDARKISGLDEAEPQHDQVAAKMPPANVKMMLARSSAHVERALYHAAKRS